MLPACVSLPLTAAVFAAFLECPSQPEAIVVNLGVSTRDACLMHLPNEKQRKERSCRKGAILILPTSPRSKELVCYHVVRDYTNAHAQGGNVAVGFIGSVIEIERWVTRELSRQKYAILKLELQDMQEQWMGNRIQKCTGKNA